MRIPSGLNEPSLYRGRRGPQRRPPGAARQLLRMVMALVLVIVAMRQASRPEIYRPFFGDAALPAVAESPLPQRGTAADASATPEASLPSDLSALPGGDAAHDAAATPPPLSGDALLAVVQSLEAADRQRLTELLAWRRRQPQGAWSGADLQSLVDAVVWATRAAGGDSDAAQQLGDAVDRAIAGEVADRPADRSSAALLVALQGALDRWYQTQVVDGGPWSRGDADAFYRYLELATAPRASSARPAVDAPAAVTNFAPGAATRAGTLPLLQQPAEYLGQLVAVGGTVARSQRRQAAENPFGVDAYWEVWLRPDDGTDHPVVLYTPQLPASVAEVGADDTAEQGPAVMAVGRFLKRRLFASAAGAEQAPVLVGRVLTSHSEALLDAHGALLPGGASAAAGTAAPGQGQQAQQAGRSQRGTLALVVALAALIGIPAGALLVWRSVVAARLSRRVRQRALAGSGASVSQLQQQLAGGGKPPSAAADADSQSAKEAQP